MVKAGKQLMISVAALLFCGLVAVGCYAMDFYPEEVEIDVLAELYEPVNFNHEMHVMMFDCAACHHHTTGTGVMDEYCAKCHDGEQEVDSVSCQDCHAADSASAASLHEAPLEFSFHDDVPNLKAAYHLSCLGCHQEMGAPTGCQDCHARTEAGDQFYHSGEYAPEPSAEHGSGH